MFKFSEARRLTFQQMIHHFLVGQDEQFATGELAALAHDFAEHLVRNGFRRLDEAAALAGGKKLEDFAV